MLHPGSLLMAWTPPEYHHGHVSRERGRFQISEISRHLAIHDNWDCNEIVMIKLPSHTSQMAHNGLSKMCSNERIPYSSPSIHSEAGKNPKRKYYLSLCYIKTSAFKSYIKLFVVFAPFHPLQNNQTFITIYTGFDSSCS
jgi:hypothetical protein